MRADTGCRRRVEGADSRLCSELQQPSIEIEDQCCSGLVLGRAAPGSRGHAYFSAGACNSGVPQPAVYIGAHSRNSTQIGCPCTGLWYSQAVLRVCAHNKHRQDLACNAPGRGHQTQTHRAKQVSLCEDTSAASVGNDAQWPPTSSSRFRRLAALPGVIPSHNMLSAACP